MQKPGFRFAGLLFAAALAGGLIFNGTGCSSSPTSSGPTTVTQILAVPTATPFCLSPSNFGLTTAGASSSGLAGDALGANAVTLSSGGTALSLSVDLGPSVAPQGRFALYADNGANQPGSLIAQTAPTALAANSWNNIPLPSP